MATLYLDFENGNDNYAGSSFALLASGVDGTIVTATFTSVTASFPNDGSLIGQYLSIFNGTIYAVYNITAWVSSTSLTIAAISGGTALSNQTARQYYIGGRWKSLTNGATAVRIAPGDAVRMMGSPAPTSLGQNGVWTSQALQGTQSISSIANTTPASVTTVSIHGYTTGDTIFISSTTNDNYNGAFEITVTGTTTFTLNGTVADGVSTGGTMRLRNNTRVKLTTPVTQVIASTGPAATSGSGRRTWTAQPNVTCTYNTGSTREGRCSDSIAIGAAFTTGLAAYWPTGTLDLSGYQQVSFWIYQNAGNIMAANAIELRLCSDTAGATVVNTISIPSLSTTFRWVPVTVDLATNLGSSIQSIALYVNTNNGAQTFLLSNIIACKASSSADSLTLTSLIGKNTTGETFWGIQSINGTRVMLDADISLTPASTGLRGYYGSSGTVTTWKRETIKLGPTASSTASVQTIQDSGTDGNPIVFSGGWNRTDMSTQTLETWLDGLNGNGYMFLLDGKFFISLSKVSVIRAAISLSLTTQSGFNTLSIDNTISNTSGLLNTQTGGGNNNITVGHIVGSGSTAFQSNAELTLNILYGIFSATSSGITSQVARATINGTGTSVYIANCTTNGISLSTTSSFIRLNNLIFQDNGNASMANTWSSVPFQYLNNCLLNDATEFTLANYVATQVASQDHDQTAGNHKIFMDFGLISAATDQRHTASGISWKLQPTNITLRNSLRPVTLSLAKVACSANNLVTVKAWMYRDNAGLNMRLVCKGGQIAGVASDVTASVTTTNAWEEETITFTPTSTGVVEIIAEAWGGTTFSGWVDDMTISQA
jgi:hypothetical protein